MYPTEYGMIIAVWYRRVVGGLLLRLGPDTSCGVYDGRGCASQYVSGRDSMVGSSTGPLHAPHAHHATQPPATDMHVDSTDRYANDAYSPEPEPEPRMYWRDRQRGPGNLYIIYTYIYSYIYINMYVSN